MFVKTTKRGYLCDNRQTATGWFLAVFNRPHHEGLRPPLRACVRKAHLTQCGHFMMGEISIAGKRIVISGTYGSDGLPIHLDQKDLDEDDVRNIWDSLVPLPQELQNEFWAGGGHNCAGKEAQAMLEWGLQNFNRLKKPRRLNPED